MEQHKLVNIISLLGVPICTAFVFIFSLTGYIAHTLVFSVGILIFTLPIFLNKWFGISIGRFFISIMAPLFFGSVSVLSGKDMGFYLGFLVIAVPPIIIFQSLRKALLFVGITISLLVLSIIGNMFIVPIAVFPFAMAIYLLNLFTVLVTIIFVVYFFKVELNKSREILFDKNKEMTDSIQYAKRIQFALLAHDDLLKKNLSEHFVFFKPKDIVSGDFYWATKTEDFFYLAICDSTGHGVPGAFMSLLNISFLNEAITEKIITAPNEIFNHVRLRLIENMGDGQDGMDAVLLKIPNKGSVSIIEYAAANNAPILLRDNKICELPKDKMPVGKGESTSSFALHSIDVQKGDKIYIYTDGFADQFGGEKGKKFKYKQLNQLLLTNESSSMDEQKNILHSTINSWRGNLEQVDDICVVGIKI